MKQYITLPNGKACSLGVYVNAWRKLKKMDTNEEIKGWEWYPVSAGRILRKISYGVHDRINRHLPWFGKGRNWA